MRIGANRRLAQAAVVLVIAGAAVTTAGTTSASAAELRSCKNISAASASGLTSCITSLTKAADSAGRTAQIADEQYLKAKAGAQKADLQYRTTRALATAAAAKAARSRTQAGVVAAHLARSGSTASQTAQVLLSGDGATRVLYNLSRMSQLSIDTTTVADDAATDSRAAVALNTQAGLAADRAETQSKKARAAFAKAKKDSAAARGLVVQAEARQRQLASAAAAASGSSRSGSSSAISAASSYSVPADASTAQKVLAFARSQIGDPYVDDGAGPDSWDCSGLTMESFAAAGIAIGGHSATAQYDLAGSRGRLVPYSSAQPGDLIFYTDGGGDMYHVTIYSGGGNMIEAPYAGKDVREVPVRSYQLVGQVARFTN